jgi:hypothetical protein
MPGGGILDSRYRDRWIECLADRIQIRGYYFPWGTKHIPLLPAGLDENGSASFAEDASAYLHADAKRRRLMTAVTDRRAPKCFLWSCG